MTESDSTDSWLTHDVYIGVRAMNSRLLKGSKKSKMKKITSGAESNKSKIAVQVFSFKTLYYIVSHSTC